MKGRKGGPVTAEELGELIQTELGIRLDPEQSLFLTQTANIPDPAGAKDRFPDMERLRVAVRDLATALRDAESALVKMCKIMPSDMNPAADWATDLELVRRMLKDHDTGMSMPGRRQEFWPFLAGILHDALSNMAQADAAKHDRTPPQNLPVTKCVTEICRRRGFDVTKATVARALSNKRRK
jgi:hypothetical protein